MLSEAEGFPISGVERPARGRLRTTPGEAVILIHGAGLDHRDWTFGFIQAVDPSRRVIAFDRPGFGGSGRPRLSGALPATQARLLRLATSALGVRRAVLVGHSWGGAVAMAWALQDPDGVAGVVSLAGAVAPWSLASSIAHGRRMREAARTSFSSGGVRQAALDAMAESFQPAPIPEGYVAHVENRMSESAFMEGPGAAMAQDIATINGALGLQVQNYAALERPVELVYGDADRIVHASEQADVAASRLSDGRVRLLKDAGHMLHHTHRRECLAAIERAAARARRRSAA
ncbi:MAG: alpha/beta hydrolase [Pseudomonadota bacterium]